MRPVPEYDAKSWLLKALRETAHAMESLLWDLDDDALDASPEDGEWSCRDLVAHMCQMERRYIDRLERMVRMETPRIDAFDADSIELLRDGDAADDPVFDMMDEFAVQRRQSVYLLWSLDAEDWERRGIHPYLGPLTVMQVAREMNEHDLAHLWQLRRLCDRSRAVSV
ncbi:MAG TPA: DinB family protein [Dehalococcoidia bacterium]|nr:DinB family protein [Dehalococcoidia bacterium]